MRWGGALVGALVEFQPLLDRLWHLSKSRHTDYAENFSSTCAHPPPTFRSIHPESQASMMVPNPPSSTQAHKRHFRKQNASPKALTWPSLQAHTSFKHDDFPVPSWSKRQARLPEGRGQHSCAVQGDPGSLGAQGARPRSLLLLHIPGS